MELRVYGTTSTADRWPPPRPLGDRTGWTCVDVGAGGGDVVVALAEIVGRDGRVYAVDSDPMARDEVAGAAAAHSQVLPSPRLGRTSASPSRSTWPSAGSCSCTWSIRRRGGQDGRCVRHGGWVVAQEPITSADGSTAIPSRCPRPSPDIVPCCPRWPRGRSGHRRRVGRGARRAGRDR